MKSGDVIVIVDVSHGFAISNAQTTERAKAVQVTLNKTGDRLTSTVGDDLKWKVTHDCGDYTFSEVSLF